MQRPLSLKLKYSLWAETLHFLDIQDKGLQQNMRGNNKMGMMLQNYVPMIGDVSQTKHCTSPYTRKHLMLNSFSFFLLILVSCYVAWVQMLFRKKQLVSSSLRHWSIRFLMKMFCLLCWSFFLKGKKTSTLTLISCRDERDLLNKCSYAWEIIFTNLCVCSI